jgi:hypothetical protein
MLFLTPSFLSLLFFISRTVANGRDMCMGRGCGIGFLPSIQVQHDYNTGLTTPPTSLGRIFNRSPGVRGIVTRVKYNIPNYGSRTGCRLNFGGPNETIQGDGQFDFYALVKEPEEGTDESDTWPTMGEAQWRARGNTTYAKREFGKRPWFGEWFACANQTIVAEFVGVGTVDIIWNVNNGSSGPTIEWS